MKVIKNKKVQILMVFLCICYLGESQITTLELFAPDKEKVKIARKNAMIYLQTLQDSLDLTRKEIRIRGFEFQPTIETFEVIEGRDSVDMVQLSTHNEV